MTSQRPAAPPPRAVDFLKSETAAAIAVFTAALAVRLVHNSHMIASPLYHVPMGGHVPYLLMAREIVENGLLPWDRAFSVNSPLYPYILAAQYQAAGGENFLAVRFFGMAADGVTCALVTLLAYRHFGALAAYAAGALAVFYGPMIFYSAELIAAVYSVFFLTLGIFLLDRDGGLSRHLASGLFIGLAAGTRPNLVLAAALAVLAPYVLGRPERRAKAAAVALGAALAVSPITIANYAMSGQLVPITLSGGHNLYLGHNPASMAGYAPPNPGRMGMYIFDDMKKLAEEETDREMKDTEVSGYYVSKTIDSVLAGPAREAALLVKKAAAAVNDYEATTYADYYFQKEISPVLAWAPGMGLVFPLAAVGMAAAGRGRFVLLIPVITTFATILVFFFVSRLRMPMAPFLIIFAGGAVASLAGYIRAKRWSRTALTAALMTPLFVLGSWEFVKSDTSNEWNKAGVVLRANERYRQAEAAFIRAARENPANPDSYRNLAVLYEKTGAPGKAEKMRERARLLTGQGAG
ncbi:MAG: hypothetical protein ACNS63_06445 [Candidatus Nitrospinota bacterium M3_3B_026]